MHSHREARTMDGHAVVSREEWLAARMELLEMEKAHTREWDEIRKARRDHPRVRVEKTYLFDTPDGRRTLTDLFDGRSQLIIQHFMFGPGWDAPCPGCSYLASQQAGALQHITHHDVTYVAVSRAPLDQIEQARQQRDWPFPWVSSHGSDFNRDFHASWTEEDAESGREFLLNFEPFVPQGPFENQGHSCFYRDEQGHIYHTYSSFARGADRLLISHHFLDLTPNGRNGH